MTSDAFRDTLAVERHDTRHHVVSLHPDDHGMTVAECHQCDFEAVGTAAVVLDLADEHGVVDL